MLCSLPRAVISQRVFILPACSCSPPPPPHLPPPPSPPPRALLHVMWAKHAVLIGLHLAWHYKCWFCEDLCWCVGGFVYHENGLSQTKQVVWEISFLPCGPRRASQHASSAILSGLSHCHTSLLKRVNTWRLMCERHQRRRGRLSARKLSTHTFIHWWECWDSVLQ